jgi:outer membrane protein assembly factor BamA
MMARFRRRFPSRQASRAPALLAAFLLTLVLVPEPAPGQTTAPAQESASKAPEPAKKDAKDKKYKPFFIVLPDVSYRPETKLSFVLGGFTRYRLGKDKERTRPSSLGLSFAYTMNNQMRIGLRPEIYFPGNTYVLNAILSYSYWPTVFYGIGNNNPASAAEPFTPKTVNFLLSFRRELRESLFAGVEYEFRKTTIEEVEPGGLLSSGTIPGSRGGTMSGIGVNFTWDNRDNIFFPHKGHLLMFSADFLGGFLGSDFKYSAFRLDMRTYIPVFGKNVLALQALVRTIDGTAPFYDLSILGGANILRGLFAGRYSGKSLVVLQAELRVHVWWRFGVTAFAGTGDVAPTLTSFTFSPFKYSLGGGIRFKIDKREGSNIRFDYAVANGGSDAFYVTILEAF